MIPHETAMSMTNHAAKVAMEVSFLIHLPMLTCHVTVLTVDLPVVNVTGCSVDQALVIISRVTMEW